MRRPFVSAITPPQEPPASALWFIYNGYRLLIRQEDGRAELPCIAAPEALGLTVARPLYLGYLAGDDGPVHCFCGEVEEASEPPAGMAFENLRAVFPLMDDTLFWLAGRAVQIVDWDRTHRYCGRCGSETRDQGHERSKICPNCGLTNYPRLAPAVIVRVQREAAGQRQILLARAHRFPPGLFSVLAGFVEPGETLEECVQREIMEEVGIRVTNLRYFGSQPWPFPHSLMVAFTADYESGDIYLDPDEIVEAGWFAADALPGIPQPPSIANRLIVDWLTDNGVEP